MTAAASARRDLATAGLIVTGAYLASRVLGWLRLAVISTTFGAGGELDAFFAAFRFPDLIFQLVAAGALSSALIPVLAGLHAGGDDERAWRVASTVANLMLAALLVLAVAVAIAAPWLVPLVTPGFGPAAMERTIELTRLMLASPILLALGALATSVLNARGRFAAAAVAPLVYNLAIIGGALLLGPSLGVASLAIGVVVGSLLNLLVQVGALRRIGFRYSRAVDRSDPAAREALVLMAPRAVGLGVSQVTLIVATTLASGLPPGSITALNVAFTLLQIPLGVIGVPLGVVVFPSLARELAVGAVAAYTQLLTRSLRLILFVMLPITALAIVLRREIVTLLFGYGRFDAAAIELTAGTLLFFLLGLAAHSLIAILARAFYAGKDTRTPVVAAIAAVIVNVAVMLAAVERLGLAGLALGIALGAWVEALLLLWALARRVAGFSITPLIGVTVEGGAAAIAGGLAGYGLLALLTGLAGADEGRLALAAATGGALAAGGLVFIAVALALRIPELPGLVTVALEVVRRRRR